MYVRTWGYQVYCRVRLWGYIPELGKYLRFVTLEDGETVHNAFPDRTFKETSA